MTESITRSMSEPIRTDLTSSELWLAEDRGIIKCWELGRAWRDDKPELAAQAQRGELPILNWKGGVEKELKKSEKYGTFRYLATWHGLRGEDLDIDLTRDQVLVCTRTGVKATFTSDRTKWSNP